MRYGIKSITMDDLASNLAISKKTIYQHFKDKDELVLEVAKIHMQQDEKEVECIITKSENAVQEIFYIAQFIRKMTAKLNPSVLFDLKKYHSKAWDAFQAHKINCIYQHVVKNIERGKVEGYYRLEANAEILSTMRMQEVEMTYEPLVYSPTKFSLVEVQMELFDHFVRGIVTKAGLDLYNNYLNEIND